MALLLAESVVKSFGGVMANDHVDLRVEEGEAVGLIGPNGAGKTTLFNCIAGHHRPDKGVIRFAGTEVTGWPSHRVCRIGIARTFQSVRLLEDMTVEENVMVGALCRTSEPEAARSKARRTLDLLGLSHLAAARPAGLPLALKRQIEVARALATEPRLLMLDESAAGLSPEEIRSFSDTLRRLHRELGLTLLIIEHVMEFVMGLSERVVVLAGGRKIAEGRPDEVVRDPRVVEAYLGQRYARH